MAKARKKRATKRAPKRTAGKAGKKAGKKAFKRLGAPKKAGSKVKDRVKVHAVKTRGEQNVWALQNALRKDGYFARAIAANKVVTDAPIKTP